MDMKTRIVQQINVTNSGCWEWNGYRNREGYGEVSIDGKKWKAHRASYAAFVADPGKMFVCHHCDNPRCVNPAHLFLGTNADNVLDSVAKSRWTTPAKIVRGERHGMSRLTEKQVVAMRAMNGQQSQSSLARMFGVSTSVVGEVLRRETWRHI